MEILRVYEKVLHYLEKKESEEYYNEPDFFYIRFETDDYINLSNVEKLMLENKICFSTKIRIESEYLKILMFIFEHLVELYEIIRNSQELDRIHFYFDEYLSYNTIISNAIGTKNEQLLNLFIKFNIKTSGNYIYDDESSLLQYDKVFNLFRYSNIEELLIFSKGINYDTNIGFHVFDLNFVSSESFSALTTKNSRGVVSIFRTKKMKINDLLDLIEKIKIEIWNNNLIEDIYCDKEEYIKNINFNDFIPNLIHEKHNIIYKELIEKTWRPSRLRDWCMDVDELKELS